ncbi:MAG: 5'-3' exonuclease H3TH domain-containing protein, partial [Planctomycetota bacterium]
MSETFFLIDGHAHCYKSFYAIRHLSAPDGRPTNAAFGFTRMILNLLEKEKPDYIAAAFDTPDLTFRHEEYEEYKAQRQAMPDELQPQIPIIRDILGAANVPLVAVPGYEADDVIGTLAKQAAGAGIDVYIATGDKDALQLLDGRVRLYDTQTGKAYSAEDLEAEKGIRPDQVPDMMALSGDTSDNVPGIHGVGPKTALKLIREYGTLENVLAHADEVSGKVLSRRLAEGAEDARTSRRLVTLDLDVPLDLTVPDCKRREPDKGKLLEIFTDLGFKKFIAELGGVEAVADAAPVAGERGEVRYHTVDTKGGLTELAEALAGQDRIAVDLETTSRRPMKARIVGFSFAWEEREAWYVPVAGPLGSQTLPLDTALEALRPVLESERPAKIGQNLKYDCVVLRNAGARLRGIAFDTMVAAYLLDPDRRRYNLDDRVRVTGREGEAPVFEFLARGTHTANITGEKVTEDQVVEAVRQATDEMRLGVERFVVQPRFASPPYYELRLEGLDEATRSRLGASCDRRLAELNVEYRSKRHSGRLGALRCVDLPPGTLERRESDHI